MTSPVAPYLYPCSADPEPWRKPGANPDQPGWGPGVGIGVWLLSVMAIFGANLGTLLIWALVFKSRTGHSPTQADLATPTYLLFSLSSTVIAHGVTLAVCWFVVHRTSRFGFFSSLGWHWTPEFRWYHALGIVIAFFFLAPILSRFIPSGDTDFSKILNAGPTVRLAVAILAVATAPLIEEIVYRGILYGGLRRQFRPGICVVLVSLLFLAVHVPQYWGGWAGLVLLGVLSLTLTIVRANTRSVLPGFMIHLIFNGIQAISIVFFWDRIPK